MPLASPVMIVLVILANLQVNFSLFPIKAHLLSLRYAGGDWIKPGLTIDINGKRTISKYRMMKFANLKLFQQLYLSPKLALPD